MRCELATTTQWEKETTWKKRKVHCAIHARTRPTGEAAVFLVLFLLLTLVSSSLSSYLIEERRRAEEIDIEGKKKIRATFVVRHRAVEEDAMIAPLLASMPAEIVDSIQEHLDHASDVMAYHTALGIDGTCAIAKRALAHPEAFLDAGAPARVVRAMLSDRRRGCDSPVPLSWLSAAVRGDRRDVLALIHSLADVDHAHDITPDSWASVGRARWRRLYGEARLLLMTASSGGSLNSLLWLLDFYASPRFGAPRPLFNQTLMSDLCATAIRAGRTARAMMSALHDYAPRRPCSCTMDLAFASLIADRPDLVDWMADSGCSASAHIMGDHHRGQLLDCMVSYRAARSLAWIAERAGQRSVVEHMFRTLKQPPDPEWCAQTACLIMEMHAVRTLLVVAISMSVVLVREALRDRVVALMGCGVENLGRARRTLSRSARPALVVTIIVGIVVLLATVERGLGAR
nr:hypothetical protein [Pandoravirus massiliensis]